MNPFLAGLTIPAAMSASGMLARTVQTVVSPFAIALETALGQNPREEGSSAIATKDSGSTEFNSLGATQNPNLILLGELLTGHPQQPGETGVDLAQVRTQANLLRDNFQRRLQQALTDAGIAGGLEVRLRINPENASVEVVDNHPQRVAIEGLFASDPQLSQDFRSLTAIGQLLRAADSNPEFAEAYGQNPWQAVARFPELFDKSRSAILSFSPSEMETRLDLNAG